MNGAHETRIAELPGWAGYVYTALLAITLALFLELIRPAFPLADSPIPYVLLIMAAAYLFGLGPAILAFVLGLIAFFHFSIEPILVIWPPAEPRVALARLTAYLIGTGIVGFATVMMRRARENAYRLAEERRLSSERITGILESITNAFISVDRNWRFTYVNSEAEQLIGKSREALMGRKIWDEADGLILDVFRELDNLRAIEPVELELRSETANTWLEVRAYPSAEGLSVYLHDITERVKLREALKTQVALLQRALLPRQPTIAEGYAVAAKYVPAYEGQEIGGDFYDVFKTESGKTAILIGDVSGKGIEAAALAAGTRSIVRAFTFEMSSARHALEHANILLYSMQTEYEAFVTAFLAILDPRTGEVIYANAGHPPAVVYHANSGDVEFSDVGSVVLGMVEHHAYIQGSIQLLPGDRLALYTDGVSEARSGGDFFNTSGIAEALTSNAVADIQDIPSRIISAACDWAEGRLRDDAVVIVIERANL